MAQRGPGPSKPPRARATAPLVRLIAAALLLACLGERAAVWSLVVAGEAGGTTQPWTVVLAAASREPARLRAPAGDATMPQAPAPCCPPPAGAAKAGRAAPRRSATKRGRARGTEAGAAGLADALQRISSVADCTRSLATWPSCSERLAGTFSTDRGALDGWRLTRAGGTAAAPLYRLEASAQALACCSLAQACCVPGCHAAACTVQAGSLKGAAPCTCADRPGWTCLSLPGPLACRRRSGRTPAPSGLRTRRAAATPPTTGCGWSRPTARCGAWRRPAGRIASGSI